MMIRHTAAENLDYFDVSRSPKVSFTPLREIGCDSF
jgi:hypothetical protein